MSLLWLVLTCLHFGRWGKNPQGIILYIKYESSYIVCVCVCVCSPQFSSRLYTTNGQSSGSKYSHQCLSGPSQQESTAPSPFPKPIYSYSILIFMALKNSKTGSLPVSEIYSFMTEHFPYFKTAPDGWKNSVRHNLSLNKCFEKVENKSGNSSRKGCLWALNPAKVEKMQEELHKWRRKDPFSKSMLRPEDLDHLLGERPDKLKSVPLYNNRTSLSRFAQTYNTASSSFTSPQVRESIRHPQCSRISDLSQRSCYLPPAAPHPSNSFPLYSSCRQHSSSDIASTMESLNQSIAGKMPPVHSTAMQAEYSVAPRSMQDFLLEGDTSYDIDMLNPSLTDLQFQGNLWEELRQDSLMSDPDVRAVITTASTSALPSPQTPQTSSLHSMPCVSQSSEMIAFGRRKGEVYDEIGGSSVDQHISGLHPMVYSGVESLAGYLTACTTSISLL
uniref:Forkhead box N1 n=1 Tax=Myripristis murdjan TaxID=586833 RepID=A0A667XBW1_9TELE